MISLVDTYFITLASLIGISFFQLMTNGKRFIILYIVFSLLFLIFSFKLVPFSGDYENYVKFSSKLGYGIHTDLITSDFEKGFTILCVIIKKFISSDYLIHIISLSSISFILIFIAKKSPLPFLSFLIYFTHFHWWIGIVLLRQLMACCIILYAINMYIIDKNKVLTYLILVLVATLFHNTAIIFLLVPVFFKLNPSPKILVVCIILSFILGKVLPIKNIISYVAPMLSRGDVYTNYFHSGMRGINILAYCEKIIVLCYIWRYGKDVLNEIYHRRIITFYSLCVILTGFLASTEASSRFASYFDIFIYCVIVPVIISMQKQKVRIMSWAILSVYLSIYIVRFMTLSILTHNIQ